MLTLTDNLKSRIAKERDKEGHPALYLRVAVDAGGCSGFKYLFSWDTTLAPDDTLYEDAVILDDVSAPYLRGATIDFVKTLMGSDFKITNPNAVSGCGCGQSFSV